jgi:hypothetical protein
MVCELKLEAEARGKGRLQSLALVELLSDGNIEEHQG